MADNIVGGLFGIDPAALQQQQQATMTKNAFNYANLAPAEQAQYGAYVGGGMLGQAGQGLLGIEDPQLKKARMAQQLASQFDITSPDGLKQYAAALAQNGAPELANMAAERAMQMEAKGLDIQKTKSALAKSELSATQEEKLRAELADAVARGAKDQEIISIVSKYGSADKILQELSRRQDRADARAAKAAAGGEDGLGKLTPAQKAVDNKFSKEYTEFFAGGGINNLEKNVEELGRAIQIIEQSKEGDTSGKIIGLADKSGTLSYVSPTAADVKDLIGGVAQSNLRQVLGGQFAAKEGEALLQRQYDTAQTKENNLKRLRALYNQAAATVKTKKSAAQYYEEFGTLKGFKGTAANEQKPPTPDKNQEALDWIAANPNDPRVPAIKKKLGIQ